MLQDKLLPLKFNCSLTNFMVKNLRKEITECTWWGGGAHQQLCPDDGLKIPQKN
jgi:hypothetical protein